uniref:Uncharacterized protein n=1 Tax=Eutreptiella gymnastica TaxID=73025 RepID=A0A7S4D2Q4_9EUGL
MEPTTDITFIGKRLHSVTRSISNTTEMMMAATRLWLHALGCRRICPRQMASLLGRLQWVLRPLAGAAPFLAGWYRSMCAGSHWFTRAMVRSTGTALMLGFPQHALHCATGACKRTFTFFSDAALDGDGFWAGVVGALGIYRSYRCPKWVSSLQQAELYAAYAAMKVAVGNRFHSIAVGIDNGASRIQASKMWAAPDSIVQHRLLRRIFWLRAWSNPQASTFRMPSAYNPAEPLSRCFRGESWSDATTEAERRRSAWGTS